MLLPWPVALSAILFGAIPIGSAYIEQSLVISVNQVTLDPQLNIASEIDSWSLTDEVSPDMYVPKNQTQKWEGLITEYGNKTGLQYTSKLGYLLLIDRSVLTGTSDDLNGYNWDTTNGLLVYSENGPNICGLYTNAFDRPCLIINSSTAKQLILLIQKFQTADPIQPYTAESGEPPTDAIYARFSLSDDTEGNGSSGGKSIVSAGFIVGITIGALIMLALIYLISICAYFSVLRRRHDRERAARRQQGINTLTASLTPKSPRPLDPKLLKHLRLITTGQEPLSLLEQSSGSHMDEVDNQDLSPKRPDFSAKVEIATSSSGPINELGSHPGVGIKWINMAIPNAVKSFASSRGLAGATQADGDGDACAICLDYLVKGQEARQLPCRHVYHKECIDEWLVKKSSACPLCKADCAPRCIQLAGPKYRPPDDSRNRPVTSFNDAYMV
ncbi:hypothetical protein H4R33_003419 [Dimargaris cristalligena]|nr:hypothetical protein H4R33_003419 [Dimargaris cristalligena]